MAVNGSEGGVGRLGAANIDAMTVCGQPLSIGEKPHIGCNFRQGRLREFNHAATAEK